MGITTFGQLGDIFVKNVMSHFKSCTRIDDRCHIWQIYLIDLSIKSGTHSKRTGKFRPIRRVIESVNVKLLQNWKQFISLPENKEDMARFLTEQLMDSGNQVSAFWLWTRNSRRILLSFKSMVLNRWGRGATPKEPWRGWYLFDIRPTRRRCA